MKPKIKFSHNWNNKLNCDYFTTIRTNKSVQFYLDNLLKEFDVVLNNKIIGEAKLMNVDSRRFHECDMYLTFLDTGIHNYPERINVFKRFGITLETDIIILTFKTIKKRPIKT